MQFLVLVLVLGFKQLQEHASFTITLYVVALSFFLAMLSRTGLSLVVIHLTGRKFRARKEYMNRRK